MTDKTKGRIVAATKQLVATGPFAAINVTTIMATAGLRRQTFYDHFRDKYDVLGYLYQTEIDAAAAFCGHYKYWPQTLATMLQYFSDNAAFYRKVLAVDEQNAPEDVIRAHLHRMIGQILNDLEKTEGVHVEASYAAFLETMLSDAFVAELRRWLMAPSLAPVAEVQATMQHFIDDMFAGLVGRLTTA